MNGLMRLICQWTYLYRCQESASTTMSKLDGLLKHFFSSNWANVFPSGDHLEKLTYITHFTLSRHSDHSRELCLELIQDSSLLALQKSGNIGSVLAPERTAIAINAVLLSFHNIEREIPTPSWPSSSPPAAIFLSCHRKMTTPRNPITFHPHSRNLECKSRGLIQVRYQRRYGEAGSHLWMSHL